MCVCIQWISLSVFWCISGTRSIHFVMQWVLSRKTQKFPASSLKMTVCFLYEFQRIHCHNKIWNCQKITLFMHIVGLKVNQMWSRQMWEDVKWNHANHSCCSCVRPQASLHTTQCIWKVVHILMGVRGNAARLLFSNRAGGKWSVPRNKRERAERVNPLAG